MPICRPGKSLLKFGLAGAAGLFAMNIIRRLKERRKVARQTDMALIYTCKIPTNPRIASVSALPVEIWGAILDYVVKDQVVCRVRQWSNLTKIVQTRLVCQLFRKEVDRALHQHLMLIHIHHHQVMRAMMLYQVDQQSLLASLLGSAIFNSASSSIRRNRSATTWPIIKRIRNCVIIATHLDPPDELTSFQPRDLMRLFCTTASSSRYCHDYIYMGQDYAQYFNTHAQGDQYLEIALLVACGFCPKQVISMMVELVKERRLSPYVGGKVWGHTKSGRRWPTAIVGQDDLDREWTCERCGEDFRDAIEGNSGIEDSFVDYP